MPNQSSQTPDGAPADPHRWLEEVEDNRALAWVQAHNEVAQARLEADPDFAALRDDLLAILDADDRIPFATKRGEHYYNFWQDEDHPRGVWRRTTPEEYRKERPAWDVLIDLDALNAVEGENWVWHGAHCLRPRAPDEPWRHCLISLSRGGADADVTREFDLVERRWVDEGFQRDEAKGGLSWIDRDSVYVYTDFGAGSLTASGYPRLVKAWRRGTPMSEAVTVFAGGPDDMSVAATRDQARGYERDFVSRARAFYDNELYLREDDGTLRRVEVPNSARKQVHRRWLTLELREPWTVGDETHPAGALLAADFDAFMAGSRQLRVLFTPTARTSLADATWTRHHLVLNVLDDVKNRLYVLTPGGKDGEAWACEPLVGTPEHGSVSLSAVDDEESDEVFLVISDYLMPTTLYHGHIGEGPRALKRAPARFDAGGLEVSQYFATSRDGTPVPYFLVAGRDIERPLPEP